MGMETTVELDFTLSQNTPQGVLDILRCIVNHTNHPNALPDDPFFLCERWDLIGSWGKHKSKLTQRTVKLTNNSYTVYDLELYGDFKNYDNEISKFLDWICPYIDNSQIWLGWSMHCEYNDPTLYYLDDCGPMMQNKKIEEYCVNRTDT